MFEPTYYAEALTNANLDSDKYSFSLTHSDNLKTDYTLSTTNNNCCTPRSLLAIESIGLDNADVFEVPVVTRNNIWSKDFNHVSESIFMPFIQPPSKNEELSFDTNMNKDFSYESFSSLGSNSFSSIKSPISPTFISKPLAYSTVARQALQVPQRQQDQQSITQFLTFRNYKGIIFTVPKNSKFFVIKSYNILDVTSSFTHNIWTSTELGNRRLDRAFNDIKITSNPDLDGKIFLLFSVNSSGKFCGVAEMKEKIDFNKSSDIWVEQTRWKGIFPVEWLLIKDVPNRYFQHLKIPNNEFKPVTNSKDTQEVPFDIGISMLKIMCSFRTNT
ncbi:YT521-B-like domain-containing protein [Scheffersomyces amazonensis]|uniref:YT521-B-like domain-containing protein n=1 Tax=Scheffersomyces amazonensis TaxID=1078765 RepID=UPI00315D824A